MAGRGNISDEIATYVIGMFITGIHQSSLYKSMLHMYVYTLPNHTHNLDCTGKSYITLRIGLIAGT